MRFPITFGVELVAAVLFAQSATAQLLEKKVLTPEAA